MLKGSPLCEKPWKRYREVLAPVDWPLSFPFYSKHIWFETLSFYQKEKFFSMKCWWAGIIYWGPVTLWIYWIVWHNTFFSCVIIDVLWKVEIIDTSFLAFHFITITPSKCGKITFSLTINFIYIRRQGFFYWALCVCYTCPQYV